MVKWFQNEQGGIAKTRFAAEAGAGMRCPECDTPDFRTIDSRPTDGKQRRRRICINGHRFTTFEIRKDQMPDPTDAEMTEIWNQLDNVQRGALLHLVRTFRGKA